MGKAHLEKHLSIIAFLAETPMLNLAVESATWNQQRLQYI